MTSNAVSRRPSPACGRGRGPASGWEGEGRERTRARSREAGFTLIELLVVIVIIGLLATVVVVNVLPTQDKAMREKAKADIALIEQALEMYRLDNFAYPRGEEGLAALQQPPASLTQPDRYRRGGYIKRLPADPWGQPYQYRFPGTRGAVDIFSWGADQQEGGEGDNADIGNWA